MVETPPQQTVYSNVRYADPRAAIEFLTEAFAFESHFVVTAEDGGVEHAQVRAAHSKNTKPGRKPAGHGF